VWVTDFMKVSLMVKAAIEAHIKRMPRRFSERGKMRSFTVRVWVSGGREKGKCPRAGTGVVRLESMGWLRAFRIS
jgi:hypothetical protein